MKVELLVNLKTGDGRIISKGTVFSDKEMPIPEFILKRIGRGMARIIEKNPPPPVVPEPIKEEVKSEKEVVPDKPVQEKKILKKKILKKKK